jgi:hypothetical protein
LGEVVNIWVASVNQLHKKEGALDYPIPNARQRLYIKKLSKFSGVTTDNCELG